MRVKLDSIGNGLQVGEIQVNVDMFVIVLVNLVTFPNIKVRLDLAIALSLSLW